jgi:microcystin-dependent protein
MVLPDSNPVKENTDIEISWANPTMSDIASEITGSLPRSGVVGMDGPLTLSPSRIPAQTPYEAVSKAELDARISSDSNFLPAGAIQYFAMNVSAAPPIGWLVCNGAEVLQSSYSDLYAAIGSIYGTASPGKFKLPDLRGYFLRGFDNGAGVDSGRAFGSTQADSNLAHNHAITDPQHTHSGTQAAHNHAITEPNAGQGHRHSAPVFNATQVDTAGNGAGTVNVAVGVTGYSTTGISLADATPAITIGSSPTGISIADSGGTESRPKNVAMVACIRAYGGYINGQLGSMALQDANAVRIAGGSGNFTTATVSSPPVNDTDVVRRMDLTASSGVLAIISADTQVLTVNSANPQQPILTPRTNVANGLPKLDASGMLLTSQYDAIHYVAPGTAGYVLTSDGANWISAPATGGGGGGGDMYLAAIQTVIGAKTYNAGTLKINNAANTFAGTFASLATAARTYTFKDADGTVAFTTDIPVGFVVTLTGAVTGTGATGTSIATSLGSFTFAQLNAALSDTDAAPLDSPAFTGNPTAPTATAGDNDTSIATTAFVTTAIAGTYGVSHNWTAPQRSAPLANSSVTAYNLAAANNFTTTSGSGQFGFTGLAAGQSGMIKWVKSDAVAPTKSSNVFWVSTTPASLTPAGTYLLSYYCDGTNVYISNTGALV